MGQNFPSFFLEEVVYPQDSQKGGTSRRRKGRSDLTGRHHTYRVGSVKRKEGISQPIDHLCTDISENHKPDVLHIRYTGVMCIGCSLAPMVCHIDKVLVPHLPKVYLLGFPEIR